MECSIHSAIKHQFLIIVIIEFSHKPVSSWCSAGKESACNVGDLGSIPGLGRSPGQGHGNPLRYSCLEDSHGQRSLAGLSMGSQRVGHNWVTKHNTVSPNRKQTDALNLKQNSSSLPDLFPCFCLCLLWFRSLFKKSFLGCHHLIYWVTWSKERPNYLVKSKARIERKKHSDILVTVYIQVKFLLITGSQNKFLKNTRETCGRTFWTRKRQRPLSVYY